MDSTTEPTIAPEDVILESRGPTTADDVAYARRKVAAVGRLARGPVLFVKVDVTVHDDPGRERPAFAKAELDLNGQLVRAHATGSTVTEAVDLLEARLRERMERSAHRAESLHLRHRNGASWHHGDAPTPRPVGFPRPVEERELVRRKSFAVGAETPDEAVDELEQLDHDFYLFTNVETGDDNVVHRLGDDRYELLERAEARGLDEATDLLDLGDEPFVFFRDPTTGRGRVVYRRYDGHYGLIVPADDGA